MPATAVDARYELALRRWWDLNTALYYLLSAAVVHSGPLARSDIAFVDKRYVRGPWRDGRGYSQWLFSFGDEANVRTQQSLRLKVDSAALAHSADMPKLQAHVDELLSNWCKIVGNSPDRPEGYAWRLLTSLKISDANNLADLMTKYIKFDKWRRIMDFILNASSPAKSIVIPHHA